MNLASFAGRARRQFVDQFREQAEGRKVIHLGYCGHSNPGDNAISLAEDRILREAGVRVQARVIDIDLELRYPAVESLVRKNPGLPIVFRGGGTLNDVYPPTAERHARIINTFRDRSIMESAVGIHYSDVAASDHLRRAISAHPDFRILVRDDQSYDWATKYLDCPVSLVPDAVLTGYPQLRRASPTGGIGVAVRHDLEVSDLRGDIPPGPYVPWADEPRAWQEPRLIPSRIRRRVDGPSALTSLMEPIVAKGRLARAVRLLARYEVVVTDRLHIALVCIMHGIPVVVVDNSYGKLSAAFRTWHLEDLAQARLVDTFDDALEVANSWLRSDSASS